MKVLDPTLHSETTKKLMNVFVRRIVGQDTAKQALLNIIEKHQAGLGDPNLPAGNALFLGPTGTGKTHIVEAMCEALFGAPNSCLKIDCAEYQHGHEIAKLVGSPPGYLGHRETSPMLTQATLDKFHTDKLKLSVLLFDEIEKSSDTLWNLLLGILDKAQVTTGTNEVVSFSNTVIVMTSNVGSAQMQDLIQGGLGFASHALLGTVLDSQVDDIAKQAAKRKFSPEFFNRLEEVVVFHNLNESQIETILSIELGLLQQRLLKTDIKFFFHLRKSARETLIKEGFDKKYGARHIKRAINRRVLSPLSNLLASGQISPLDVVVIEEVGKPAFEFTLIGRP